MNTHVLYIPLFIYLLVGIWVTFMLVNLHVQFFFNAVFSALEYELTNRMLGHVNSLLFSEPAKRSFFNSGHQVPCALDCWGDPCLFCPLCAFSIPCIWSCGILVYCTLFFFQKCFIFDFDLFFIAFCSYWGYIFISLGVFLLWTAIWALFISLESLASTLVSHMLT